MFHWCGIILTWQALHKDIRKYKVLAIKRRNWLSKTNKTKPINPLSRLGRSLPMPVQQLTNRSSSHFAQAVLKHPGEAWWCLKPEAVKKWALFSSPLGMNAFLQWRQVNSSFRRQAFISLTITGFTGKSSFSFPAAELSFSLNWPSGSIIIIINLSFWSPESQKAVLKKKPIASQ